MDKSTKYDAIMHIELQMVRLEIDRGASLYRIKKLQDKLGVVVRLYNELKTGAR
jgi:hypothetical protein